MADRDYIAEFERGLPRTKRPDNDLVAEIKEALDWSPPELWSIIIGYRSDIDVTHYNLFHFLCNELVHDQSDYKYSALLRRAESFVHNINCNINDEGDRFDGALESSIWDEINHSTPADFSIPNSDRHQFDEQMQPMKVGLQLAILLDTGILVPRNPIEPRDCRGDAEQSDEYGNLRFDLESWPEHTAQFTDAAIAAANAVQAGPGSAWHFMKEFYVLKKRFDEYPRVIDLARLWKLAHVANAAVCHNHNCPYATNRPMRAMLEEFHWEELYAEENAAAAATFAASTAADATRLSDDDFDEVMAGL